VWGDTGGWTRPEGANEEFVFEPVFEAGGAASELVTATKGGVGDRFGARLRASSLRRFDPWLGLETGPILTGGASFLNKRGLLSSLVPETEILSCIPYSA
jgi:hypothetical protein